VIALDALVWVLTELMLVKTDASDDPLHRRALGVHGLVVETEHLATASRRFGG
jgi:hypothetical protein